MRKIIFRVSFFWATAALLGPLNAKATLLSCDVIFKADPLPALSPWAPQESVLYRGLRIKNDVDIKRIFFENGDEAKSLPSDPFKLRDLIITHKDGLRSQGDGIVSTSTDIAIATTFSDTTSSGGTGLLIKLKAPLNAVSLNRFATEATGTPYDHGALHGFEYEKEVIFPAPLPGRYVLEVMEVVPSGDPHVLKPMIPDALNFPFAVKRWILDSKGALQEENLSPPLRLPILMETEPFQ